LIYFSRKESFRKEGRKGGREEGKGGRKKQCRWEGNERKKG